MFRLMQPGRSIRARRNGPVIRYWIRHGASVRGTPLYSLFRDIGTGREAWMGRERGWVAPDSRDERTLHGKLYKQYGHAYRTLRLLQEADRAYYTAAARKQRLAAFAPDLVESLRAVLPMAQGAPYEAAAADRARILLRRIERDCQ